MEVEWDRWHDIFTTIYPKSTHCSQWEYNFDPLTGLCIIEAETDSKDLKLHLHTSKGHCFHIRTDDVFEVDPYCLPHLKWHHCEEYPFEPKPNFVIHSVQQFHILVFVELAGFRFEKRSLSGKMPIHAENFCSDCWDLCKWTHHYDYPVSNYPIVTIIDQEKFIVFGQVSKLVFIHINKDESKNFKVSFKPGVMWFGNENISRYLFIVSDHETCSLFDVGEMKRYNIRDHSPIDFMKIHTCHDPHNNEYVFHFMNQHENYKLLITDDISQLIEIPDTKMMFPVYCDIRKRIFYKRLKIEDDQ